MEKTAKPKKKKILEIFDSLFIMILCFATLLLAMLMTKNSQEALTYTIHPDSFTVTILGLAVCLVFIIRYSEKELKSIMKRIYLL